MKLQNFLDKPILVLYVNMFSLVKITLHAVWGKNQRKRLEPVRTLLEGLEKGSDNKTEAEPF